MAESWVHEMHVGINAAGQSQTAFGVDDPPAIHVAVIRQHSRNSAAIDQDMRANQVIARGIIAFLTMRS